MDQRCFIIRLVLQAALFVTLVRPEEVFNTTPPPIRTNFSCLGRSPGFYADVESNCKVYYTCDDYGNKFTYRCPEETAFRQDALICDHAHLVDCSATTFPHVQEPIVKQKENSRHSSQYKLRNVDNSHRTFSRSFQVIQNPNKSLSSKEPGFVFSASVFLRDLDDPAGKSEGSESDGLRHTRTESNRNKNSCNGDCRNRNSPISSTVRPTFNQFQSKSQSFDQFSSTRTPKMTIRNEDRQMGSRNIDINSSNRNQFFSDSETTRHRFSFNTGIKKSNFELNVFPNSNSNNNNNNNNKNNNNNNNNNNSNNSNNNRETEESSTSNIETGKDTAGDFLKFLYSNNRDYPYLETLRSIQENGKTEVTLFSTRISSTTTEIPIHALTVALKPLVPNGLEDDPYYPLFPTSTEAYYTPSHKDRMRLRSSTQPPWHSVHFQIPDVLPDLNTLEDLVDRRKFFYIPRINPG